MIMAILQPYRGDRLSSIMGGISVVSLRCKDVFGLAGEDMVVSDIIFLLPFTMSGYFHGFLTNFILRLLCGSS